MRLYCARPLTAYGTDLDRRQLARVAEHFPEAEVLDPAAMFASNAGWLAAWPELVGTLDLIVLWADEDGFIGAGCLREVTDAMVASVPVVTLDWKGRLRTFAGIHCQGLLPSPAQIGMLIYGSLLLVAVVPLVRATSAKAYCPETGFTCSTAYQKHSCRCPSCLAWKRASRPGAQATRTAF